MLDPLNWVTGAITFVLNVASTDGRDRERTCCKSASARTMPAAACWTVG